MASIGQQQDAEAAKEAKANVDNGDPGQRQAEGQGKLADRENNTGDNNHPDQAKLIGQPAGNSEADGYAQTH